MIKYFLQKLFTQYFYAKVLQVIHLILEREISFCLGFQKTEETLDWDLREGSDITRIPPSSLPSSIALTIKTSSKESFWDVLVEFSL